MSDLKRKLTSRKFWAAIISFVSALLTAFNYDKLTIEQTILIITGIGSLICYIFGESYIDGKSAGKDSILITPDEIENAIDCTNDIDIKNE